MNRGLRAFSDHRAEPAPEIRHVAHGVLSLDLGGLERLALALARRGREHGHRVSMICIDRPGRLADDARALGAEVHSLDMAGNRSEATARAAELFARLRPDVLHTHQIGALWHLGRAARRQGAMAVVHTEHSDHAALASGLRNQLKSRLWWHRAGRLPDRFCCVSEDIARSVRRWRTVPGEKVCVVDNGVDTALYADRAPREPLRASLGFANDQRVIGTVGRLNEVKRQDLLLRAFARIVPEYPQARLLLVGDGPEREALQDLTRSLGLADRIVFAGYQPRTEHYLAAMDVFALSSRHEGLPLALLEAWASGLPVVSSAVGGIPQVVRHGHNGLLFDSGDEAGLAATLARLLDDPAAAAGLATAGRGTVEASHSLERTAERYDAHYRAALAQR
ncbi:glycosyltransferase [Pseudoxanthomonas putridarboris]|uniref:Glycosyltransferase n=1 Tax=Pseudoxanthomonas putridarboris TaxID=752605 RepID=A0ABU9IYF7_9GAMM